SPKTTGSNDGRKRNRRRRYSKGNRTYTIDRNNIKSIISIINSCVTPFTQKTWLPHHVFIFHSSITHMPKAFVLMNAELGSEDSIVGELRRLGGVKEVYQVYGVYDIVAQVESDTMEKVKEIITWKLRKLNGVKSTLTMIVME